MCRNIFFLLIILACRTFAQHAWVPLLENEKTPPSVTLLQSNSSTVSFRMQVNGIVTTKQIIGEKTYNLLSIPDGEYMQG